MASSASAAALLELPFPSSSSSSDDSDDLTTLPPPLVLEMEVTSQPTQQQQWLDLERDCNLAMKALAREGDVDQVIDLFAELTLSATSAGRAPNVLCYNTLLNALAEAGLAVETRRAFDEMLAAGMAPNASSFNILVKLYAWRTAEFHLAYDVIDVMRRHGVVPDVGTYSTLVTGLCRVGKLDEAWGVLDWMLQEGCFPMVHTYTPIVQGYCREGRIEEARKLIDFMEDAGCPPNAVTYNVLIKALCDDGRFDEVKQLLTEIKFKGLKPSTVTYNTYMDALSKKGMAEEALRVFAEMGDEGLCPTAFTLSVMLNFLCRNSKFSEAISFLERSTELDRCAAVVAYNTVMIRLCDMGRWLGVLELLADMIKKGIIPNTRTLNIFIHSLCIRGKLSVAKNMVYNQVFPANAVTYNTLIHWFCNHGKFSEADQVFMYMKEVANIVPDEVTYTIMVDGLCRQGKFDKATACFKESHKIRLSKDLLTVLVKRLVHSDRIWNTIDALREIEIQGFVHDYSAFNFAIRSFSRDGCCPYRKISDLEFLLDAILGPSKQVYSAHKSQEKG